MPLSCTVDGAAVARFAADARRHHIDARGTLLAVSGGPDSLAMLLLAHAALGADIVVATVDHGLRAGAAADASMVATLCATIGVDHATLRVTPAPGASLQARARAARYDALAAHACSMRRATILTAHHADDQAETMLMRLMRGSGITGLSGIRADRRLGTVRLVRPLLDWTRGDLGAVAHSAGLDPVDDPANRDPRHDRTRARMLLTDVDPRSFARVAANLADAEAALAWAAMRAAQVAVSHDAAGWWFDPSGLPHEIVRRVVIALFADVSARPPGPEVERLIERLGAGEAATLGPLMAKPGARWHFSIAPARRVGSADARRRPADAIVH